MIDDIRPPQRPVRPVSAPTDTPPITPTPSPESFRTPSEIAAEEDLATPIELPQASTASNSHNRGGSWRDNWRQKLKLSWPPGKKEYLVAAIMILLIGGGVAAFALLHDEPQPKAVARKTVKPKPKPVVPKTVPSTLSGLPVDPNVNARPVTGVMIENSMDSRPQSALGQASVVFEAIAEGGITRFLALYQDTEPADIGPIRSARPYFVKWAMGFDAGYAHVGGSPQALADIRSLGVRDLDQFANAGAYHRISTRVAPHNVYTGISNLTQLQAAKGYTSSTFTGFARKKAAPAKVATAKTIDIRISGPLYNVHYDYNVATNTYNRSEGGAPHIDALDNTQISPHVVVVLAVPFGIQSDGHHSDYQTIGSGQAYVYQDGLVSTATWTKVNEKSQITFADAAGKPVLLNPGKTWLTAVSGLNLATSAP